jgi:hypothetical protein
MEPGHHINAVFFKNVNISVSRNTVRTVVGGFDQQSGRKAWVAGYLTRIRIVFHRTIIRGHKGS